MRNGAPGCCRRGAAYRLDSGFPRLDGRGGMGIPMTTKRWNRRQVLHGSARMAAGAAVGGMLRGRVAAQMPHGQPLNDERVRFVTTTEASPWQNGTPLKPTFNWSMLNLNVDVSRTNTGDRPMEGFGACFNELGWT